MELIINGRAVQANVGVRFVKELDKKFFVDKEGIKFGFGLRQVQIELEMTKLKPHIKFNVNWD